MTDGNDKNDKKSQGDEISILIAEDSPTQAERLQFVLEEHGYRAVIANNGRKALELARAQSPTLIISDIVMPEMDGYQLCREIKLNPSLNAIPVMLLTSLSDPIDVVRGLECGADNFLVKPYDDKYLLSRVSSMLANRHLRDTQMGVEVVFSGSKYFITSSRLQILNLLLSSYETAVHKNQELIQTQDELKNLNEYLESRVRERTAQLQTEVAERTRAEEEVRKLNADLEQRVAVRTEELQFANKELEAFSYSVSHDLRAPVRAISGFSGILIEEHLSALPEEVQHHLLRIQGAAHKMGQLIEDLLNLSRINRPALRRATVNLTVLAQEVIADLRQATPQREVDVRIADGMIVTGDPNLLRIGLDNLIRNAWKFTARTAAPRIEIGTAEQTDGRVYFVRDNGAGFDMAYVDKLFGAFQRLHSADEFEGTGIGLAIVQRIFARHGGRVWAEGKIGEGATFYFSLPS